MSWLDDICGELASLEAIGRRRSLRTRVGSPGREVTLDGRSVLNFSSNNYLGLADDPALSAAAVAAIEEAGTGSGASRLILGNQDRHEALERALAQFQRCPRTLLFNSGYNANVGVLAALTDARDVVFSDALNHASIIDGCRLSRAQVTVYPHADTAALEQSLRASTGRRRYVVTDAVFSMDGDRAPLRELAALCRRYDAALVVDEAHAVGALGPDGRGVAAELGVEPDLLIGTFGKSFGSFGAYVCGHVEPIELLLNRARSFVFTTALPPAVVAASQAALETIRGERGSALRQQLTARIEQFRVGLESLDLLAAGAGQSAIFPILVGDEGDTMSCCAALLERGIYAQGIRPPTVARGTSRLRFTLMATHTADDVARALGELETLRRAGRLRPAFD